MIITALFIAQALTQVRLESLDLRNVVQDWGTAKAAKSVDGNPLKIGGVAFDHGVGTHANSWIRVRLNGNALEFRASVGIDDETNKRGRLEFRVWVDGKKKWGSGHMRADMAPMAFRVSLVGAKEMLLEVEDGEDGIDHDHADWADAVITVKAGTPPPQIVKTIVQVDPAIKIAMGNPKGVMIHGPRVIGTTPGRPFLFRVPVTGLGQREFGIPKGGATGIHIPPIHIARGILPNGLTLGNDGIIRGKVTKAGTYKVTVQAGHGLASDRREYTIVAGLHKLAMTPPMGWNSWNIWATAVDAGKVKASADAFIKAGLADYAYQYVNIDDAWEGGRDANGFIETNKKFGDMKALADYVHSKGLKLGIYSGPGPKTCANYEGSYQHELKDAQQYAKWGIDYLKYDWCSYDQIAKDHSKPELIKPYALMRNCLDQVDRDIVYSLCQYGMGDVFVWGKNVAGGNLWRTTGDITDTWRSMSDIGFSHNFKSAFTVPGGWNDPDMLVVGKLGWGPNPRPTRLTPNEQITHITLWSLLAAPLIIGCDLTSLDPFTKALLCNHDVIEVDQDPLGRAATRRIVIADHEVWARPLWDGTTAVGLFNRGHERGQVVADLARLGYRSAQPVRDLWQMKDLPGNTMMLKATVPAHGAMLFKVGKPQ
jgi:alpha-galactosidase